LIRTIHPDVIHDLRHHLSFAGGAALVGTEVPIRVELAAVIDDRDLGVVDLHNTHTSAGNFLALAHKKLSHGINSGS
jgi:hypothetical protein